MTRKQYLAALDELGFSQVGAAAVWGVSPRTAQAYAAEGPPPAVALAIAALRALPTAKRAAIIADAEAGEFAR